jgi:hypothetical protein
MARGRKSKAATASQNDNTVASRLRSRTVPANGEDESTPPADPTQQVKNISRVPQPEAIERDATRMQIQMTCSCIDKLIKERGSRRACLGLLNKLDDRPTLMNSRSKLKFKSICSHLSSRRKKTLTLMSP